MPANRRSWDSNKKRLIVWEENSSVRTQWINLDKAFMESNEDNS